MVDKATSEMPVPAKPAETRTRGRGTRQQERRGKPLERDGARSADTHRKRSASLGRPSQGSGKLVEPDSPGARMHDSAREQPTLSPQGPPGVGAEHERCRCRPTEPPPTWQGNPAHESLEESRSTARKRGGWNDQRPDARPAQRTDPSRSECPVDLCSADAPCAHTKRCPWRARPTVFSTPDPLSIRKPVARAGRSIKGDHFRHTRPVGSDIAPAEIPGHH